MKANVIAEKAAKYLRGHLTCKVQEIETFEDPFSDGLYARLVGFDQVSVAKLVEEIPDDQALAALCEKITELINEHAYATGVRFAVLSTPPGRVQSSVAVEGDVAVRCVLAMDANKMKMVCYLDIFVRGIDVAKLA